MDFWKPLQGIIQEVCCNFDKRWQIRKRVIDTHFLVLFIFKLVLSKNKQGYKSVLAELWENQEMVECQERPVSASSLCEARQKLPETIFVELNQAILTHQKEIMPLWCGHRVFAGDGSKINVPHELLSAGYIAPNEGQYYPQGTMSCLYHLGSGFIHDCILSADRNERRMLIQHMETLLEGDVLVLDRGYFSYLILYEAVRRGIHLICRLQSGAMNNEVDIFWKDDKEETIINYCASASVKSELKKQGHILEYKPIKLRLIKYKIDDEVYVCATTLIGGHYPLAVFPAVYHGRWGIEALYKISKEFIDVEDFHSKTEQGVKQEVYAHVLLINIARILEIEVNRQMPPPSSGNKDRKDNGEIKQSYWQEFYGKIQEIKINFKNCLLVIGRFIEKLLLPFFQENLSWLTAMLTSISRVR